MKFMMMVKHPENSVPPPKPLMDAMERISREAVEKGMMVISGGLAPTAQSKRVRLSDGKISVIDGPFTETKEIIGGFAILEYPSKEAALEGAKEFMELHKQYWPGWNAKPRFGSSSCRRSSPPAKTRASKRPLGQEASADYCAGKPKMF